MLREIRVRNFAVIDAVSAAFGPGLNVLTGETGAGKSMLIDAILLIRGARAQTDVIRADTETATVEAVFDIEPQGPAAAVLDGAGLGPDGGQLVIRRELAHSGRHRAFVNDSPVTVALLERLGDHLVEVHGQHEHQRLLEASRQLDLLDRFADAEELRDRVGELFAKHRAARAEVERARAAERDRAQREDLPAFSSRSSMAPVCGQARRTSCAWSAGGSSTPSGWPRASPRPEGCSATTRARRRAACTARRASCASSRGPIRHSPRRPTRWTGPRRWTGTR